VATHQIRTERSGSARDFGVHTIHGTAINAAATRRRSPIMIL
jgi:hypothetical protein